MALQLIQRFSESVEVSADGNKADLEFTIWGTASESPAVIYTYLGATIPSGYLGLYLQSYQVRHKGADFYDVVAHYGKAIVLTAGTFKISGKTSGKQLHREQSLETVAWFTTSGTGQGIGPGRPVVIGADAPLYNCLIGVHKDKIEGVDVVASAFAFTVTKRFSANAISPTFLSDLIDLKPSVNNAPVVLIWKGQTFNFATGELLLADLNLNDPGKDIDQTTELFEIVYEFEKSKNQTNFSLGDITGINKLGHNYAWTSNINDTSNGYIVSKPVAVYVERVYEFVDPGLWGLS